VNVPAPVVWAAWNTAVIGVIAVILLLRRRVGRRARAAMSDLDVDKHFLLMVVRYHETAPEPSYPGKSIP
jgi:hypothetical protein